MSEQAGAEAVERYLVARGTRPVRLGAGRFAVYVPGRSGLPDLEVCFASTRASRGVMARVRSLLRVPQEATGRALHLANRWNRASLMPHAVLATRDVGGDLESMLLLEGYLVPATAWDQEQIGQFVEQVIAGSRRFWASSTVRGLCTPVAPAATTPGTAGAFAELVEEVADQPVATRPFESLDP